jgi:hypothetical protein
MMNLNFMANEKGLSSVAKIVLFGLSQKLLASTASAAASTAAAVTAAAAAVTATAVAAAAATTAGT